MSVLIHCYSLQSITIHGWTKPTTQYIQWRSQNTADAREQRGHTTLNLKGWEPEWSIPQLNVWNGLKCPKNEGKKMVYPLLPKCSNFQITEFSPALETDFESIFVSGGSWVRPLCFWALQLWLPWHGYWWLEGAEFGGYRGPGSWGLPLYTSSFLLCHHFLHNVLIYSISHLSELFTLLPNTSAIFPSPPTLPYSSIHPCVPSICLTFSNKTCLSHAPKLLASHQKVFHILYFTTVTQHTPFIITLLHTIASHYLHTISITYDFIITLLHDTCSSPHKCILCWWIKDSCFIQVAIT